jgi:cytochrome c-type biogenesis protein
VLPLVPGYVSMVSGLSAAELEARGDGATPTGALRPVLRGIGLFVAGFTLVFVALGATASTIGQVLKNNRIELIYVSGAVIVLLGVIMVLSSLPTRVWANSGSGTLGVVSRLTGEHRFDVRPSKLGVWAAPVMGMAFAFAWTPCIGPVLGVVLGLASRTGTLAGGVLLLFAYSLGLALPFVLVGLAFGRMTTMLARARHWLWVVELVAGLLLVAFGVILLTDNVGWLSNHISNLLNDIGLGRLTKS